MALPPLVVSGQKISSAHVNAIRNFLGTWSAPIDADGNNLTEVGTLTASNILVTGSLDIDGAISGEFKNSLATLGNTAGDRSYGYRSELIETNGIHLDVFAYRSGVGAGHGFIENRIQRKVDVTDMGYIGFGSSPSAYVSIGVVSSEMLRVSSSGVTITAGTLHINAQDGANEGGELHLADPTGSNYWLVDNYNQYFRLFRGGGGALFQINPTGRLEWPPALATYASDAAAASGGLTSRQIYATPTGELRIKL